MPNQNNDNMPNQNDDNISIQEEDTIQKLKNFIEDHSGSSDRNTTDYRLLMGLDSDSIINDNSKCNLLRRYITNIKNAMIMNVIENNPGLDPVAFEEGDGFCMDINEYLDELNTICPGRFGGKRSKKSKKSKKIKKSKKSKKIYTKKRYTKKHRRCFVKFL